MSDNKKRGNTGDGESSTKSTAKCSRVFDTLSKICGLAKELREDVVAVEDFERLLDNQKRLKADLKTKEAEIQNLRTTKDDEIANLRDEIKRLETDKAVLWKEFSAKQKELEDQLGEFEDTRHALRETKDQLQKVKEEARLAKAEKKQLSSALAKESNLLKKKHKELEGSKAKHNEWKLGCTVVEGKLRRLEDFVRVKELEECDIGRFGEFEGLADECHALAFEFFRAVEETPASLPSAIAGLTKMPLSLSTSAPAQVMRCAVAEYVIGRALTDHIFVDMYFRDPNLQHAVSTMLSYLETRDGYPEAGDGHAQSGYIGRESIVRLQLLSESNTGDDARLQAISSAKRDVCKALDSLLPSSITRDVFHSKLEEILERAIELWAPLQRSTFRVSAEFGLTAQLDRKYDFHSDFGPLVGGEKSEPILPLFPQIGIRDEVIYGAKALWSDQTAVVAAKEEMEKAINHDRMKGHEAQKKIMKRRLSVRAEIPVTNPGASSGQGRPAEGKQGLIGHKKGQQSQSPADVTAVVALGIKEVPSGPKT
ncbi:hypothetical protein B0H67DRAFT_686606 [Lasiosphaeris hirsuta]|uniref:Uncharacterized protein n=1 Tax=Lasiosphaeris hirsuta TaxID=260670 RepID=A0AA40A3E7_9PEZI|nr:hypothetical protein B0H67DRAFT_686606 [Lasiosphaeris hirsuta]